MVMMIRGLIMYPKKVNKFDIKVSLNDRLIKFFNYFVFCFGSFDSFEHFISFIEKMFHF